MWIGVGGAAYLGQSVQSMFGPTVIAEGPVAFLDLLDLAQRVWLFTAVPPHLLTLYEQGVPVVDARVNG